MPCGSAPGCPPGARVARTAVTRGLSRRPRPGGEPPGRCLRPQPEAAKGLEGLLQIGTETVLSGTACLRSTPGNIRYLRCEGRRGFPPSLTSAPSPSPASREVVRERGGRGKGRLLPLTAQLVLSGTPGGGSPPLPECLGAPPAAEVGQDRRWREPSPGAGGAAGHGRRGDSQLLRLLGRWHDFVVEVTRENAASEVALAAR